MDYGFVKVAAAIPSVRVADCTYNVQQIKCLITEADSKGVEIMTFPELCLTGYSCGDLFATETLLDRAEKALCELADFTVGSETIAIIGLPLRYNGSLYNCAAILCKGKIMGIVPKQHIPNYKEFYEQRWFASGCDICHDGQPLSHLHRSSGDIPFNDQLLFYTPRCRFAVEICEDLWAPVPPSSAHALAGADLIFNLSASNELIGKHHYLKSLLSQQSARTISGYIYASAGYGESSTDLVFGGNALIYENGLLLEESERFSTTAQLIVSEIDIERLRHERLYNNTFSCRETHVIKEAVKHYREVPVCLTEKHLQGGDTLTRHIDATPFIPKGTKLDEHCEEAFAIQVTGLCRRISHTRCQTVVVGISGGLDSTLALLVCAKAFDKLGRPRKEIVGITMPGFGTTGRTYNNALKLMQALGVTIREISIRESCLQHFSDIGHDADLHDVTYENAQARERTQILMDVANQTNGLVIGTGDLSELALGWATYNGDHMSMYGVNGSIPKTLVKHLVGWIAAHYMEGEAASTLFDIIDTPISPELIPADENGNIKQKTEDLVGPYELHDFFLYHFIRHGFRPKKIFYLARVAFAGRYPDEVIKKWLTTFFRRFFNQQFKRSCLPDGPKVGSVSLSPRGDWRMPSDAYPTDWLSECEEIKIEATR